VRVGSRGGGVPWRAGGPIKGSRVAVSMVALKASRVLKWLNDSIANMTDKHPLSAVSHLNCGFESRLSRLSVLQSSPLTLIRHGHQDVSLVVNVSICSVRRCHAHVTLLASGEHNAGKAEHGMPTQSVIAIPATTHFGDFQPQLVSRVGAGPG